MVIESFKAQAGLPVILTGDRPTGPLHIGHYAGSLKNRVLMQDTHDQFILIADLQALTDNADNPDKISRNVLEVATDYMAAGIDPDKSKIVLQSQLPEVALLSMLFSNLVSVARVGRNPTVKAEIEQKGMANNLPLGFFSYPVSQAADIAAFRATVVPAGDDQVPMIELTNEIVRRFNRTYNTDVLVEAQAVFSSAGRLPGIDGQAKMSKSLGNTINLKATPDEITHAVKMMYTDPGHLRITDPGKVEGNVVFTYLDAFDPDKAEVDRLKQHYRQGGLGDRVIKDRLNGVLQATLDPIRAERLRLEKDPAEVIRAIRSGTVRAQDTVNETMEMVRAAMGLNFRKQWSKYGL